MPDLPPTQNAPEHAQEPETPKTDPATTATEPPSQSLPEVARQLLLTHQLASQSKSDGLGVRARTEHQHLKHLAFDDIQIALPSSKTTRFNDNGEFETIEHSTHMALPDGSRINKAEEVAYWCCKFRKKKQLKYCGPMTKERANFCARCNRVLCAHYAWQFLFSTKKHCAWCLFVRFVETTLGIIWLIFKLFAAIIIAVWRTWFHAYR